MWILAAVAAVVARLTFSLAYWVDQPLTQDEHEYLSLARSLAAGQGFQYDEAIRASGLRTVDRAPGYPAFLAAVGGGSGIASAVPWPVDVAQALVGAVGVWLIALLAHGMGGDRASIAAAWIAALYPPLVWVAGYAMSEALFWPMGLAAAALVDRARRAATAGRAVLAGLAAGAAMLVRPEFVLFTPMAMAIVATSRSAAPTGRSPGVSAARRMVAWPLAFGVLCGVALAIGPWMVRNAIVDGRIRFVSSNGGVTFWTGNHPLAIGDGDMAAVPALKLDNQRLRAAHPGLSEAELEPIFYREALAWMASDPLAWLALEARKLFYLAVPVGPSYAVHSVRYRTLTLISYLVVVVLASLAIVRRRHIRWSAGLLALVATSVLTTLVFFAQERFRIPIIDPALVILAGIGVASVGREAGRS